MNLDDALTLAPEGPSFGERLAGAMEAKGRVVVGIDPHPPLLRSWDLPTTASGARDFGLRVIEAVASRVAAVKPQVAFFERYGSAGLAALEDVIAAARAADVLSIVDAKRGDIGSTMQGYADAYCVQDSPLAGDAVTLSPYLGVGAVAPAIETALANGRGVFLLCLTSNPDGERVQLARAEDGVSTAADIARQAAAYNASQTESVAPGSVGLVVGATIGDAARRGGVDLVGLNGPVLAPGVGAQGGDVGSLHAVVGDAWRWTLPSISRAVLAAGPDAAALAAAADAARSEMA